jgi:mRNA-degrading endonuclease RelE of RelBE toxin-antitoxin system
MGRPACGWHATPGQTRPAEVGTDWPYRIEYAPPAEEDLRDLTARQPAIVLETVDEPLTHQPTVEPRPRQPMRPHPLAPWDLRLGALRVYDESAEEPELVVLIRAIGLKERNGVRIGGEVIAYED